MQVRPELLMEAVNGTITAVTAPNLSGYFYWGKIYIQSTWKNYIPLYKREQRNSCAANDTDILPFK